MAYQPATLQPGQCILCLPTPHEPVWDHLLDDAIAWSSGPFVHAAFVGNGQLIEQTAPVVTSPLEKYAENGWAYTIEGMTPAKAQAMIRWGLQHLGMVYGYRAILADGLLLDGHDWTLLSVHPRYPTCSGFVERASRLGAGIALSEMPLVTPTALAFSPRLRGPRPWDRPAS